ncbi:MAG: class I SAM-dependent methyltransferase [Geobacteraceae bacterium]|nr:class I SAM-dependent methyltransferase [Geobacteraceae bacterium]
MSHSGWNAKDYKKFDEDRAGEYAVIANEVFAPIYPVIARQILERCGVESGLCIDVGCGPANLSLALAKLTSLTFCAMDFSPDILRFAQANIDREELAARIATVVGDVHRMPVPDGVAALIISRGSMRFWRNRPAAFREMWRVLEPGGKGYVGGGLGSSRLAEEINREMIKRGADWQNKPKTQARKNDTAEWREIMAKAGFSRYEIIRDDSGSWVYFEKEG